MCDSLAAGLSREPVAFSESKPLCLSLGLDSSIVYVVGGPSGEERRKLRGVVSLARSKVAAQRGHDELVAMAKEAVAKNAVAGFLDALDPVRRDGRVLPHRVEDLTGLGELIASDFGHSSTCARTKCSRSQRLIGVQVIASRAEVERFNCGC